MKHLVAEQVELQAPHPQREAVLVDLPADHGPVEHGVHYRLTVLADACGDIDEEVHRVLVEKVFPRQATVTAVRDWAAELSG